jgi:hypothetical protein
LLLHFAFTESDFFAFSCCFYHYHGADKAQSRCANERCDATAGSVQHSHGFGNAVAVRHRRKNKLNFVVLYIVALEVTCTSINYPALFGGVRASEPARRRCSSKLKAQRMKYEVWLGWAYLAKTVCKPQYRGADFDPPMVFCACSMQNVPAVSGMLPGDFRTKQKGLPPKRVLVGGPGWLW